MNSLTQTDLQTYLHRLIMDHLTPTPNAKKRGLKNPAEEGKQTTTGTKPPKRKGDRR